MDQKPPSKQTSLRNPYAAMANVFQHLAENEQGEIRKQRLRESQEAKELALREPPPKR